jgi:hypothetical protein
LKGDTCQFTMKSQCSKWIGLLNNHKYWNLIPPCIYLVPTTDEIPLIQIQTPFGSNKYIKWLKEGLNPEHKCGQPQILKGKAPLSLGWSTQQQ